MEIIHSYHHSLSRTLSSLWIWYSPEAVSSLDNQRWCNLALKTLVYVSLFLACQREYSMSFSMSYHLWILVLASSSWISLSCSGICSRFGLCSFAFRKFFNLSGKTLRIRFVLLSNVDSLCHSMFALSTQFIQCLTMLPHLISILFVCLLNSWCLLERS